MSSPNERTASRSKIAVITGASAGIGRATAEILSAAGYRMVANGRRRGRLDELEAALNQDRRVLCSLVGDASEEGVMRRMFAMAKSTFDTFPDVCVLCAGHGLPGTLLKSDPRRWPELLEVNYLAIMRQMRECAELFLEQAGEGGGIGLTRDIVILGSTVGRQVSAANSVYGSTKFAIHSIAESLRQELCSHSIRVSLIEPGFVKTEFQESAGYDMAWFRSIEEKVGPLLSPHDVARAVAFVVAQPAHVHIDEIRIRPVRQPV